MCVCIMPQVLSRWEAFLSQVKPSKEPVRSIYVLLFKYLIADIIRLNALL